MKRKLLDQLAASHDFEVPPSMVEAEFTQIWRQLEHEASHEEDPAAALAEMEGDREDYRKIAERRVRLGLLLSEIGQQNGVQVSPQEMQRLAQQAAQQYSPQDRQRFLDYVQQDPVASAQLRAPLYEDKVVDFLFEKAEISDRAVTREELEAAIEEIDDGGPKPHMHDHDHDHGAEGHVHGPDCNHDHDHDHAAEATPAPAPKKAKAAKAKAEPAAVETAAAEPVVSEAAPAKPKRAAKPKAEAPAAEGEAAPAKPKRAAKPKTEA
jgi:trigger factor